MAPALLDLIPGVLVDVLDVTKKRMVRSWILLGTTLLNIGLTIPFVMWWGMLGAVIATAVAVFIGPVTIMNIYYAKALKLDVLYLYYKSVKGIIIFELPLAVGGYFLSELTFNSFVAMGLSREIVSPMLSLIIVGIAFVTLSAILIFFFGTDKSEREKVLYKLKLKKKPAQNSAE